MEMLMLYILLFIPATFSQVELDSWLRQLEDPSISFLQDQYGVPSVFRKLPVAGISVDDAANVGVCDQSFLYCVNNTSPGVNPDVRDQPEFNPDGVFRPAQRRRRRRQVVPVTSCPDGFHSLTCKSACRFSEFGLREEMNFANDTSFHLLPECFDIRQVQSLVPTRSSVQESTVTQVRFRSSRFDPALGPIQPGCNRSIDFTVFNRTQRKTTIMFYFKVLPFRNSTDDTLALFSLRGAEFYPLNIRITSTGSMSFGHSSSHFYARTPLRTVVVTDEEFHHFTLTANSAGVSANLTYYIDGIYGGVYGAMYSLPDIFSVLDGIKDFDAQDFRQYPFLWTERRLVETFKLRGVGLHLYPAPDCYCPQSHPLAASGVACLTTENGGDIALRVNFSFYEYSINSVFFPEVGSTWLSAPNVPKATIDISFSIEYALFGTTFSIPNAAGLRNLKISITVDGTNFTPVLYMSENCHENFGMPTWDNLAANEKGSTGASGDRGDRGVSGAKGAIGVAGVRGQSGVRGAKGERGPIGLPGSKGLSGLPGSAGATGATGATAATGATGAARAARAARAIGETGDTGPKGDTGYTGYKGYTGASGATGAAGYTGVTGPKGDRGDWGLVGIQGPEGNPGADCASGASRTVRSIGDTGDTGPRGANGASGSVGDRGPRGPDGLSGPKGFKGDRGPAGIEGEQGDPGVDCKGDSSPPVFTGSRLFPSVEELNSPTFTASPGAPLTFDEAGDPVFAPLCTTFKGHREEVQGETTLVTKVTAIWATARILKHLNSRAFKTFRASSLRLEMTAEKTSPLPEFLSLAGVEIMGSCFCFERGECRIDDTLTFYPNPITQNKCVCQQNSTGTNCELCSGVNIYRVNGACYSCNCNSRYTEGNSGACDSRGQCDCISGWNRELAGLTCKPYVASVVPSFGPTAGETEVTITGGGLSGLQINFTFGGVRNISRSDGMVVFTTPPADEYLQPPAYVPVSIYDEDLRYSFDFEYRPNPNLTSLDGFQRTTYRGGLNVTLVGENMDSVYQPRLLVRYFDVNGQVVQFKLLDTGNTVDYITTNCTNINETTAVCPTPDFLNTIDQKFFDDFYRNYAINVLGPILESGTPPPFPDIPQGPSTVPDATSTTSAIPPLPTTKKRRKRQVVASGPPRSFVLGVVFDGYRDFVDLAQVSRLQNSSIIQVHGVPVLQSPAGEDGLIAFDPESDVFLRVSGSGMDSGATAEEYVVEIGMSTCPITSLSSNTLVCRPPSEKPAVNPNNYRKMDGEELPHVKVVLGNFDADLGFINYPSDGLSAGAIAGIVIGVILFVCLVAAVVFILCRKTRGNNLNSRLKIYRDTDEEGVSGYTKGPVHASEDTLFRGIDPGVLNQMKRCTIPRGNVKLVGLTGKGNFGLVYKGELMCPKSGKWQVVAVKTLKGADELDSEKLEGFLMEAMIMLDFSHTNVLSLLGVCVSDRQPMVVLPFMHHGDLKGLVKNKDNTFTVGDLLHFCLQISIGMEYLARSKFVHRDLAARNIMVNSDFIAKVADFGLSRDVYEKEYYRVNDDAKPLPVKWMSPECMTEGKFTEKSDVWAFGVVMWELFTRGANPYPSVNNYEIKSYVASGKRLDKPSDLDDLIYEIMLSCWAADTKGRPPFSHLVKELSELLDGGEEQEEYEREYTKDIKKDYYYSRSEYSVTYVDVEEKGEDNLYLDLLSGNATYQGNVVKAECQA